ncbi:hypothetical protein OSB04_027949 [Centaurea solstitialis]|uniref:Reverse transcriptase domain-containing protein n=1 Tax=Centaurea solstitialis TaxID=347529 RepID=A0AA38SM81_9ASTR|nr:hypothetical protein OSB04_027949 [Centaurea solstitialis]
MNVLSLNIRGLCSTAKRDAVKELLRKENCNVFGLQETKLESIDRKCLRQIWGHDNFDFAFGKSIGASGGTVLSWNSALFSPISLLNGDHYCGAIGSWVGVEQNLGFLCVYGPQPHNQKQALWDNLKLLILSHKIIWVVLGDFNAVRSRDERRGTGFDPREASAFNDFIISSSLHDFQLGGRKFTRFSKDGSKLSKLDRFLVSQEFFSVWEDANVLVLVRKLSDHNPLVLKSGSCNFGPKPFKVFDSWLLIPSFELLVNNSWGGGDYRGTPDIILKNKIKSLRRELCRWAAQEREERSHKKKALLDKLEDWDRDAERGVLSENSCSIRENIHEELSKLEHREALDLKQKSRANWAIDGDENSKFFHSLVNQRWRKNNIKGLSSDGVWVENPLVIKKLAKEHFEARFMEQQKERPLFRSGLFNKLSSQDALFLESTITLEEVKGAVWSCAGSKAPGPDGLNFNFLKKFWDTVKGDRKDSFNQTCTPYGQADQREPISFLREKKMKALVFKVDFAQAFDSVNWNFLFSIMKQMGFGLKWCSWIKGCLTSASISVLVNGSPTEEFHMERGLRQGDPLSPFLFLIIGEALQVMILEACNKGLFDGLKLLDKQRNVSLLQYADDALFFGLKINLSKSRLFGIGVTKEEVQHMASLVKCKADQLPFLYLGLPVGDNMAKLKPWAKLVEGMKLKLSCWKARVLSIGGRLTLIKAVLTALPLYFFSIFKVPDGVIKQLEKIRRNFFWGFKEGEKNLYWIAWDKIMAAKDQGGLGVLSLKSMNIALLSKWFWKFHEGSNSLWKDVVSEFFGQLGGFDKRLSKRRNSPWATIVRTLKNLDLEPPLLKTFEKKIAAGSSVAFWKDSWVGAGVPLKSRFPRLYVKEAHKDVSFKERWMLSDGVWKGNWEWNSNFRNRTLEDLHSLENFLACRRFLSRGKDYWSWNQDPNGLFSVKKMYNYINRRLNPLPQSLACCKWSPLVPIKVNIFIWRLFLNALPTRDNLSRRRITMHSSNCVLCNSGRDVADHCFFTCPTIDGLWRKIWSWVGISGARIKSVSEFQVNSFLPPCPLRRVLGFDSICMVALWCIWNWRNRILHCEDIQQSEKLMHEDLFPFVQRQSALWIFNRERKTTNNWKPIWPPYLSLSKTSITPARLLILSILLPPMEDVKPPTTTLRRRNSTVPPSNLTLQTNSSTTTTTTISNTSADFELLSLKPASYTSLRDILPSTAAVVQSPKVRSFATHSDYEIPIRNRLVKQAAWAYLRPMSTSPDSDGSTVFHRIWNRFSDACFRLNHVYPVTVADTPDCGRRTGPEERWVPIGHHRTRVRLNSELDSSEETIKMGLIKEGEMAVGFGTDYQLTLTTLPLVNEKEDPIVVSYFHVHELLSRGEQNSTDPNNLIEPKPKNTKNPEPEQPEPEEPEPNFISDKKRSGWVLIFHPNPNPKSENKRVEK